MTVSTLSLPSASLFTVLFGILTASTLTSFASEFEHTTYLKASNAAPNANFGSSVAIDGNLAVVGAPVEDSSASGVNGIIGTSLINDSGAAYVFLRTGVEWNQIAHLKAPSPVANTRFGVSVTVSGGLIAIGHASQTDGGRVHIYRLENGGILHEATIAASNAESNDAFGSSVSLSGQSLLVGAPGEDSSSIGINGALNNNSAGYSGAAYLFQRSGNSWTQAAYVKASNTQSDDGFGNSVAISGDTFVVAASREDGGSVGINGLQSDNSKPFAGAAYVFFRSGSTWAQQAYLKASNTDESDAFGSSIAIDGNQILIGALGEDSSAVGVHGNQLDNSRRSSGAAYLFSRSGATWTQSTYLKPNSHTNGGATVQQFGMDVAIRGDFATIAARSRFPAIFTNNGNSWMALQPFELPEFANPWSFGEAVAISGNTVLIGDPGEKSSTRVINGNMSDTSAEYAGSAHIFTPPLIEATSVRNVQASLTPIPPTGLAPQDFQLAWNPILGKRYNILRSSNLVDWTSYPGFPATSFGTQQIIYNAPREFYKVVEIDAAPPDRILTMFPGPGSFAVPRFADIRLEFSDTAKIIPSSLKLTIGSAGPFTLANSPRMTFVNGVLRYDVVDAPLGVIGSEVPAELVVADTDGNVTTYRWKFNLEKQPILAAGLFVFGSATAQQAGQRLSAAQRTVAAATVGNPRLPASDGNTWTLTAVNPNSIALAYTGTAPTLFHAGQFLANDAPAGFNDTFYRKVVTISNNAATKTLTLNTADVALTDIVRQGSSSLTENSLLFDEDSIGNLNSAITVANIYKGDLGTISANYDNRVIGSAGGTTLKFRELNYTINPSLFLNFDIEESEIRHFSCSAKAIIDLSVVPQIDFNLAASFNGEAVIFPKKKLKKIRMGSLGGLPIWMDVFFEVRSRWGGTGQITGYIYGGARKTWIAETAVTYSNGPLFQMSRPLYTLPTLEKGPETPVGPEVVTEVNCNAWIEVEPRFDFLVEGLIGPYFSIVPNPSSTVTALLESKDQAFMRVCG